MESNRASRTESFRLGGHPSFRLARHTRKQLLSDDFDRAARLVAVMRRRRMRTASSLK